MSQSSKLLALVTVLVTLGFTASACSVQGDSGLSNPPLTMEDTPPAESTPDPEVTARYEGSDFQLSEALPEELQYLQSLSTEEFAAADKYDQMRWATWALQYKEEFVEYFSRVSGSEIEAPYTLSVDSDLTTMLKDLQTTYRVAANFGQGRPQSYQDNGPFDAVMAEKLVIALDEASNMTLSGKYIDNVRSYRDGLSVNIVLQAGGKAFNMAEDARDAQDLIAEPAVLHAPDGRGNFREYPGIMYDYTDESGDKFHGIVAVVPVVDFRGNESLVTISGF